MTPLSIQREITALFTNKSNSSEPWIENKISKSTKSTNNSDTFSSGSTVGRMIACTLFALNMPGVNACPSYCTRSRSRDEMVIAAAGLACAAAGVPAAAACAYATRLGIEYDKNKCASMGCGPIMHP